VPWIAELEQVLDVHDFLESIRTRDLGAVDNHLIRRRDRGLPLTKENNSGLTCSALSRRMEG
jgi:hypothetical protein